MLSKLLMILSDDSICEKCNDESFNMYIYTIDKNNNIEEHFINCLKPYAYGIQKSIDNYNQKFNGVLDDKYFVIQEGDMYGRMTNEKEEEYFDKDSTIHIKLLLLNRLLQNRYVQEIHPYILE